MSKNKPGQIYFYQLPRLRQKRIDRSEQRLLIALGELVHRLLENGADSEEKRKRDKSNY